MGTSFSVNITSIALRTALSNEAAIEVVDPQPIDLGYERIEYHKMTAADYVLDRLGWWSASGQGIVDKGEITKSVKSRSKQRQATVFCNLFVTQKPSHFWRKPAKPLYLVVSRAGFEPATHWLKVSCSTNWANGPLSGLSRNSLTDGQPQIQRKSLNLWIPTHTRYIRPSWQIRRT